jgi:hypothetical protein
MRLSTFDLSSAPLPGGESCLNLDEDRERSLRDENERE